MGYVEGHLLPGEKVVYRARLHWIVFGWPVLVALAGVALLVLARDTPLAGLIALGFALVLAVSPLLRYTSSEFAVTDKRVIIKLGLVQRDAMETLLSKVEGIEVEQTIVGRILNYGTLIITGTGGTREPFQMIRAPMDFRRQVQAQTVALEDRRLAPAAGPVPSGEARVERECPFCAERILAKAKVCRFCGRDVVPVG